MAASQEDYDPAVRRVFEALDRLEKILDGKDYLVNNQLTEADVRLFVTIVGPLFCYQSLKIADMKLYRFASTPSMWGISRSICGLFVTDTPRFICKLRPLRDLS